MRVRRWDIQQHGINEISMPSGTVLERVVIDVNGEVKVVGRCNERNPEVNRRILMTFEDVDFPLGFADAKYLGGFSVPTKVKGQAAAVHIHCLDGGETGLILG